MAEVLAGLDELLDTSSVMRLFKQGETVDAVVKLLSEANVDVTEVRADGSSLLHSFAILGKLELVELLWEKKAQPSILTVDDSTVLHSAVRAQDETQDAERAQILTLLLGSEDERRNAMALDHPNNKGWTALKLAARRNLEKCVEVLLEHGANPDLPDSQSYTALHNAVTNPSTLKLLLTRTRGVDQVNEDGETALFMACERGLHFESALQLLEHGADPNISNKEDISPLFVASRGGHLELVKALVKGGASVNSLGASQGIGPLHWAAHKEHEEIAMFLIENGADVLLKDKEERTPLSMASPELAQKMTVAAQRLNPALSVAPASDAHMSASEKATAACCCGNVPALQALLQSGVSLNHCSGATESTLLHMAAYCGQLSVVLFLMHMGADWRAVDKDGDTVLHFSCMKEVSHGMHERTLEFLLATPAAALKNAQNSRGDTPIMVATRCQFVPRVKMLLKAKADVSVANVKRELPLHKACSSDKTLEALFYFVDCSSSLDIQDDDGWSPLMFAAKANSTLITKYLLQRGANPNIRQTAGFNALYLAAQEEDVGVCQLLLEAGADPLIAGGQQRLTPLHIAAHKGSRAVCLVLIEHGADIHLKDSDGDSPLMLADSDELKEVMRSTHATFEAQSVSISNDASCNDPSLGQPSLNEPSPEQLQQPEPDDTVSSNDLSHHHGNNEGDVAEQSNESAAEGGVSNESPQSNEVGAASRSKLRRQVTHSKSLEKEEGEGGGAMWAERELVVAALQQREEMQREVAELRADRELLLSRVRILEEERETLLISERGRSQVGGVAHEKVQSEAGYWWLIAPSEFEVTDERLNASSVSSSKFFDVFLGCYRHTAVAVKRVSNTRKWQDSVYQTFLEEINVISQVQSPHLVQFLGACLERGVGECSIVLQRLARGSLYCVLHVDKTKLDQSMRVRIVQDVCCGMAFLHSKKILHRSLVPRNILLSQHFDAKLSDYGLHRTKTECGYFSDLHEDYSIPQVYLAPEIMERREFTTAADVYSFGIIMCEVATGQKPYSDMELAPVVFAMKVLMGVRPCFAAATTGNDYRHIAETCWRGDTSHRSSFQSVLAELRKL